MSDVKWIKVATSIFGNEKILLIESMPEADSILVIWFKLMTLAGKLNDGGILRMSNGVPYTDEMLSAVFKRPLNTVRLALGTFESFGMIERVGGTYVISHWEEHQSEDKLGEMREKNRERQARYRQRQKQKLLGDGVTSHVTSRNAVEQEQDKEEEIDKENSCSSKGATFTNIWNALSADERDALYEMYVDAGDLIQEVYEDVRDKRKTIEHPFNYVCGYAKNKEWHRVVN